MSTADTMRASLSFRSISLMHALAGLALGGTLLAVSPMSAEARIVCRGDFQVVNGQEISTPYCADNYIASIAREYGSKVSDAELRNNPAKKDEVCRWIGSDTRIRAYCNEPGGRDRR